MLHQVNPEHGLKWKGRAASFGAFLWVEGLDQINQRGDYQESCPLGVLELRTSMHLTSICTLGSSWSWNVRHLIVVYSGG